MASKLKGLAFHLGEPASADEATFGAFIRDGILPRRHDSWPYGEPEDPEVARRMYSAMDDSAWYGVIVSTRTDRHQLFPIEESGRMIIDVRDASGDRPVEANAFCVRLDNFNGVYAYYRGSYGLQSGFLRDFWRSYMRFFRRQRGARRGAAWITHDNCTLLFSPRGFRQLVSSLAHVAAVRLTTYEPLRDSDVPVGDRLSSVLREYRLRSPTPPDRVIDWVMNLHEEARRYTDRGETRHRGALEGRTEQHQNVTIDFDHTIHDYLGLTHDDIQRIDTGDLAADPIIIRLREKLFAEPLFTVRPGP